MRVAYSYARVYTIIYIREMCTCVYLYMTAYVYPDEATIYVYTALQRHEMVPCNLLHPFHLHAQTVKYRTGVRTSANRPVRGCPRLPHASRCLHPMFSCASCCAELLSTLGRGSPVTWQRPFVWLCE